MSGLKVRLWHFGVLVAIALGLWIGLKPHDWQGWLGFSHAAYFVTGQNYAFYSGIGPMLLTAIGLSTIIAGLWHHLNCHIDGCPRVVRHKVDNGAYGLCRKHWNVVNDHPDDHKTTVEHVRAHHLRTLGKNDESKVTIDIKDVVSLRPSSPGNPRNIGSTGG